MVYKKNCDERLFKERVLYCSEVTNFAEVLNSIKYVHLRSSKPVEGPLWNLADTQIFV